jgi:hypothetical protein
LISCKGATAQRIHFFFAPLREISAFAFSEEKSYQENKKLRETNEELARITW